MIYIGYAAGMLLLLENMAKIIKTNTPTGVNILLFSTFFWFISFLSRKFVFDNHVYRMNFSQKARLELMYYVFCHTFVLLFVTSIMKYTPLGSRPVSSPLQGYSFFLNYLSNEVIFTFLINFIGAALFIWLLIISSNAVYRTVLPRDQFYNGNLKRMQFIQSVIFAIMLAMSLGVLNMPVVWDAVNAVSRNSSLYLKYNFRWVVDYLVGSPVIYYAYTSLKGSALVEEFSLYRKIV